MNSKTMRAIFGLFALTISPGLVLGAQAADWTVDTASSSIDFSATQTGAKFTGHFSKYEMSITLDPDHLEKASISAVIDMSSVSTGDTQRDTALPKTEWFDTADFPKSTFVSKTLRKSDDGGYLAEGMLTIRNVSKPIVLPFKLTIDGETAHAKGHIDLKRDVFGVGQGPWATGQYVALDVGLDFDLTATRRK